jgi:hypothetical protein
MKSLCEIQNGFVYSCENCSKNNFLLTTLVQDTHGAMPNWNFFRDSEKQPDKYWCRFCGEENEKKSGTGSMAIRFLCPNCHKTNVTIKEPTEVQTNDELNHKYFIYTNNPEIFCSHCENCYSTGAVMHNLSLPDSWLTFHLFEKERKSI